MPMPHHFFIEGDNMGKRLQLVKLQVALYSGTKATMRVKSFPLKFGCQTLLVSSERQGPKTKTRPV